MVSGGRASASVELGGNCECVCVVFRVVCGGWVVYVCGCLGVFVWGCLCVLRCLWVYGGGVCVCMRNVWKR